MIRMNAIPQVETKPKGFGPFTSFLSASALLGIGIGIASIVIGKF